MSQSVWSSIVPSTTSGNQLATLLNDFKDAMMSGLSGITRPIETTAGGFWIDTAADPIWYFKLYDGADDITIFTINTTTNSAAISGADALFSISKISADTVSPILELLKARIANSGQVLSGDYVGTVHMKGTDNTGAQVIVARIRAIATQNFTAATAGTDLVFEATTTGSVVVTEYMRIKDGKLGIGTTNPSNIFHAVGDAARIEKASDDAIGALFIGQKRRVAGSGQVQSGDVIATFQGNSRDQLSAEIVSAGSLEISATQNHSSTAQGTQIEAKVKKTGSTTSTSKVVIGDEIVLKEILRGTEQVDSSTTGSGQSLTPTDTLLRVTNASLVSINNIVPKNNQILVLINGTGASISVLNDAGGTAANRIYTGTANDLTLSDKASLILVYDTAATRWQVVGGSGGGSVLNFGSTGSPRSIVAATGITSGASHMSATTSDQNIYVVGSIAGESDISANPQITAGTIIGQKMKIIGTSSANYIKLETGTGLYLKQPWYSYDKAVLDLYWNGTVWAETNRESDNAFLSQQTLAAAGTIALSGNYPDYKVIVAGNSAAVALSSTPFGTTPPSDGARIVLIGNHDTNTVEIDYNDASNGCVGDFSAIILTKYQAVTFVYSSTLARYVLCSKSA